MRGIDLAGIAEKLPEVAARIGKWVLEAERDDLRLILEALSLRVRASSKVVQIEGSIPVTESADKDLVTTEQTLACSRVGTYSWAQRAA